MSKTTVPDDWAATSAIYNIHDDAADVVEYNDGGIIQCTWEVALLQHHRREIALVQRAPDVTGQQQQVDPRFVCRIISPEESPVLRLTFYYSEEDDEMKLESVCVTCTSLPPPWPHQARSAWESWLQTKISDLLKDERLSYVVCDFCEHRALDFFGTDIEERDVIPCMDYKVEKHEILHQGLVTFRARCRNTAVVDDHTCLLWKQQPPPLERKARQMIRSRWREWVSVTCPICSDEFIGSKAVEITCGHFFCNECISMYAKIRVQDIGRHQDNPFICPLPSCRHPIKIVGCIKKLVSEAEMDAVREWYKDLKNPRCYMLVVCPRSKCGMRDQMRKESHESAMVYCDACAGMWCELCLQRGEHHVECDQHLVLRLCAQYREASDAVKIQCQQKWPWIREYAAARSVDESANEWVKNNASICPVCKTGIERLEGCFHMNCSNCNTHFCYECEKILFPPYYGTHHCWLERNIAEDY